MKLYIAGKITNDPGYRLKFQDAADKLAKRGHIVLNPAVLPVGLEPADYMRICSAMLEAAEVIVTLPDWSESRGAMLEVAMCGYIGKPKQRYEDALLGKKVEAWAQ